VKYLLDPGGSGGGVNIPGVPGTNVKPPSKDGVLNGTSHYGQVLAPLIVILIVTATIIWVARNIGGFVADLVKKASLLVGLASLVGIVVIIMMVKGK